MQNKLSELGNTSIEKNQNQENVRKSKEKSGRVKGKLGKLKGKIKKKKT